VLTDFHSLTVEVLYGTLLMNINQLSGSSQLVVIRSNHLNM